MQLYSREKSKSYGDDVVGLLDIKIVEANLTRDTEMFGKMDPFLELKIGGQQVKKTAVKDEAGKNPVWNETVDTQEVKDMSVEVHYNVLEEDTFSND